MKKVSFILVLLVFLFTIALLTTGCEEAASRFTNRAIDNLESEVGGAAQRAQDRASEKARGAICGSTGVLALFLTSLPLVILIRPGRAKGSQIRLARKTKELFAQIGGRSDPKNEE